MNPQEFRHHLQEFVSPSSSDSFQASKVAIEELTQRSVHDTVEMCIGVVKEEGVPDCVLRLACVLILQVLRPSTDFKQSLRQVVGKRRVWMEEHNVPLHPALYETMIPCLSHPVTDIRNICAANIAYAMWLDQSDWLAIAGRLAVYLFDEGSDLNMRKGCVRCFVEILQLPVISWENSEDTCKRELLSKLEDLFMSLTASDSCDPLLRIDAVRGLCGLLSAVPGVFANASAVDHAFDVIGTGLRTANSDAAAVMQKFLLDMVKQFYAHADCFMEKAATLIEAGINSEDKQCQVIAMDFWYELALFEYEMLRDPNKACKDLCLRVSRNLAIRLCNSLLSICDCDVDSKDSVHSMALMTLKAFYQIAAQQVFSVVQRFFSDNIGSESWWNVAAAVSSLRSLCVGSKVDVVKNFLVECVRVLFESTIAGDVHPIIRIEVLKTLRAFSKCYPQLIAEDYFLSKIETLFATVHDSEEVYLSCFCRLLVEVAKAAPTAWIDKALSEGSSVIMERVFDPALESLKDPSIAICSLIRFSSPAAHELITNWVDKLFSSLQNPSISLNTKFSVCLIIKAIADKLNTEFPQPVEHVQFLFELIGENGAGVSEESLMCLSSLISCSKKRLSPYFERIWNITKAALANQNPTLADIAYCTLGSAFDAFGNLTAGAMHEILDVILSRKIESEERPERIAPYLKCIGCITQAVGSLITDEHRERIVEILKWVTDDIESSLDEEQEVDVGLICTVLHVYSMTFVGYSSVHSGTRNDVFMRSLCTPVFGFGRFIHGKKSLWRDEILHEMFLLLFSIGRALGSQANVPLNSSKLKALIVHGTTSTNPRIASEAKFLLNFVENL